MRVKLAEAVTKEEIVEVGVRPELHALKCDACGKIFKMERFSSSDVGLGQLSGIFNTPVNDHRSNVFIAHACSFLCAHELFTGGWRKMSEYAAFAEADVPLVRAELKVTSIMLSEALIRSKWQAIDHTEDCKVRAKAMWASSE